MIILTPAYGRDYKSKAAVLIDWDKNLDFIINDIFNKWDGKPCNKQDINNCRLSTSRIFKFRYARNTKVFIHKT